MHLVIKGAKKKIKDKASKGNIKLLQKEVAPFQKGHLTILKDKVIEFKNNSKWKLVEVTSWETWSIYPNFG